MRSFLQYLKESAEFPMFKGKTIDIEDFANSPQWQAIASRARVPLVRNGEAVTPLTEDDDELTEADMPVTFFTGRGKDDLTRRWGRAGAVPTPNIMQKNREVDPEFGLGGKTVVMSDDQIQDYLQKILNRSEVPKGRVTPLTPQEKNMLPNVHNKVLKKIPGTSYVFDPKGTLALDVEAGELIDLEDFKKLITQRPKVGKDGFYILAENKKMSKSAGPDDVFKNFGIPALNALVVNERTGKFTVMSTCPGAGKCVHTCYALGGGYVQYSPTFLKMTRALNFLLNDPQGFFRLLDQDVKKLVAGTKKKNVYVRWHDAGDFFSDQYQKLFYTVCLKNPTVRFYAYTKVARVVNSTDKPDNFVINFSAGSSLESEEAQVDLSGVKLSRTVPNNLFKDLIVKRGTGVFYMEKGKRKEETKWVYKKPEFVDVAKQRLAKEYNIPLETIITYDEMVETPESDEPLKWNVIVKQGEGDKSASRRDVHQTLLFIH